MIANTSPFNSDLGSSVPRWQFGLKGLFKLLATAAAILAVAAIYMQRVRRQEAAIQHIRARGGQVFYDYQFRGSRLNIGNATADSPKWIPDWIDERYYRTVVYVDLQGRHIVDEDLKFLQWFPRLRFLNLRAASVTDDGIKYLAQNRSLAHLDLDQTSVSDEGLHHLYGLYKLEFLKLDGTAVTSRGVSELRRQLPGCRVDTGGPILHARSE